MKINYKNMSTTPKEWLYKCKTCDTEFTKLFTTPEMQESVTCECGAEAHRCINKPHRVELDPISGDHPGATDKWVKLRESKMRQEKKNLENHGTYE
jgi:DNA-directed RNA polymerase subunit RPC12/RpoP